MPEIRINKDKNLIPAGSLKSLFLLYLPIVITDCITVCITKIRIGIAGKGKRLSLETGIAFLFMSLLMTGCGKYLDDDQSHIDPLLKPYLDKFVHEASLHGKNIDTNYLKMSFADLKNTCGCGGITYYKSKMILIDSTVYNWKHKPENTLYHELGHLFLNREHNNKTMGCCNYPVSIMNDGHNPADFENGSENRRSYYIDELFNQNTPTPIWAN